MSWELGRAVRALARVAGVWKDATPATERSEPPWHAAPGSVALQGLGRSAKGMETTGGACVREESPGAEGGRFFHVGVDAGAWWGVRTYCN